MSELTEWSLADARAALAARRCSARELTQAYLDAIEKAQALNAYLLPTPDVALQQAAASDKRLARGSARPLEGLPLGIKDLFCTQNVRTTAASAILDNFVPPYESTVTAQLWRDGAVLLGKLNQDEFAMGSSNENSAFGAAINPWRRRGDAAELVPGGSSGGAAAAVAAGLAAAALGSDTGGSIRQPAAFTGTVGLKPSYGRCSRWGMIAFASSLDQAGPICRTVRDAAIMLTSLAGHDAKDSTSARAPVEDYESQLGKSITGKKIGILRGALEGLAPDVQRLWDEAAAACRSAGAELVDVRLPHMKYALPAYYIIAPAEASSNLARYDGVRYSRRHSGGEASPLSTMYARTRAAGFGDEVKRRILTGVYVLSAGYYDAYYGKAQNLRRRLCADFDAVWRLCDMLLLPTAPHAAFALGEKKDDPVAMYANDVLTVPANLAGLPALSVPMGLDADGLPLGMQLMAPRFAEAALLQMGQVLEEAASPLRPQKWWLA